MGREEFEFNLGQVDSKYLAERHSEVLSGQLDKQA